MRADAAIEGELPQQMEGLAIDLRHGRMQGKSRRSDEAHAAILLEIDHAGGDAGVGEMNAFDEMLHFFDWQRERTGF